MIRARIGAARQQWNPEQIQLNNETTIASCPSHRLNCQKIIPAPPNRANPQRPTEAWSNPFSLIPPTNAGRACGWG